MAKIAEDASKKKSHVLILAHRNSLLKQHRDLFESLELIYINGTFKSQGR